VAALGGLVACASLAGAQSVAPDNSPHLVLVPDSARADAALERSNARTVARYDAFTLVEARGDDEASLRAAGADRRDDMREVSLPGGSFDPLRGRGSLAAKGAAEPNEVLAVVQFTGPVKDAWLDRLRDSGARIVQYLPQNAYLVHATGEDVDRLAGLVGTDPAVRAVTHVSGGDKQGEDLPAGGATRLVAVQTLTGAQGADARRAASAGGARARADSSIGGLTTQFVSLSGAEIDALAADPAVVSVTPYSMPELLDERSAQIVAGNLTPEGLPSGPGYLSWLDGNGFAGPNSTFDDFVVDVADTGLDIGTAAPSHSDFYVSGSKAGASRVAYARDWTADPSANDCSGHGTNVASIAAGYGAGSGTQNQDSSGFKYGIGAAPRALIGASKIFGCNGGFLSNARLSDVASAAYASAARISNHSWGNGDLGRYSPDSRELDFLARDAQSNVQGRQELVEVVAAGNDGGQGWGSVASPGTAKNVITVGASENRRPLGQITCGLDDGGADQPGDVIDFSSRGPTLDGRLKPDVVAPGTRVVGAAPQPGSGYTGSGVCLPSFPSGNPFYSLQSGTSQAAPAVSGEAALIRDWFDREHGGPPSPALTKAIIVGSATDLAGGNNGKDDVIASVPNADEGWGRAHLGSALDDTERDYVDQTVTLNATGERFARSYVVDDTNRPLKVTLAWTDAPGAVGSKPALVNDLDLVVRQGGRTYKGNMLAGGRSITGGDADRRNNLETVSLPEATGRVSVEVLGTNIVGDGIPGPGDTSDQDFALVVSNAGPEQNPVLAPEQVVLTPGGDADNFLETGEPFTLGVSLRNGGDADATNVSGTISGPFTQATAEWPDIEQGAAATNTSPYLLELGPAATCGADVTASLDLTTGQDAPVPVTFPTGEPGVPLTNVRTDLSAVPIPDGSSAGIRSTVGVKTPGRIKDLNVTIGNITHTWVGDLVIELTSPQGTTVRLVNHPGGPDNSGNNFVNTTFDDEAGTNISAGSAPYTGSFRPQDDQLSRFDGEQRQGTWTLRIRDLFTGDTGTLSSWQMTSRRAICNHTDKSAPDTSITSGPSTPVSSRSASFTFVSSEPGSIFECSIDGTPITECNSPQAFSGLADGTHTFRVQARDLADNLDPSAAERSWTVDGTAPAVSLAAPRPGAVETPGLPPATPAFALGPTESDLADARANRLTVLAGCGRAACRVSAELRAGGRRPRVLGRASASLGAQRSKAIRVKLTPRGRAALRRVSRVKAELRVTVSGAAPLALSQSLVLREVDMRRVVRRGLPFAGRCSESCSIAASLLMKARDAVRHGLPAPGNKAVAVGAVSSSTSSKLVLRLRKPSLKRLLRDRRLGLTVKATVTARNGRSHSPSYRLTVRR
jgi:subtilisin-like proprotein convertase family protein